MPLRSRSNVKVSVVLTRADHLCIHNYIRSLLYIISRPILTVRRRLEPATYCLGVRRLSQLSHADSYKDYTRLYTADARDGRSV